MYEILLGLAIGCILGLMLYTRLDVFASIFTFIAISIYAQQLNKENNTEEILGGSVKRIKCANYPTNYFKRDDSKHKKIPQLYDKSVDEILTSGKFPCKVSHYISNTIKTNKFSRILDMNKTLPYKRSWGLFKPQLHWGQLKLLLSEIEFLTKVVNDSKGKRITFIYVGAGPGDHIEYLSLLFPQIHFELYDLVDFTCRESNMIKIHKQFFTDDDAKQWVKYSKKNRDAYIAFCTDIRTRPITNDSVVADMQRQFDWWKVMNPDMSIFKFRLPWTPGETIYPKGDIYIQLYPGPTSTETRLIVRKNAPIIKYDNIKYMNALYYHNRIIRSREHINFKGYPLDKCYDCAGFEYVISQYLKLGIVKKPLPDMILNITKKIDNKNKTIKYKTMEHITEELEIYYRKQYEPCDATYCRICPSGLRMRNNISNSEFSG